MSDTCRPPPPASRWLPATVMLTVALLLVASLLNGVGQVGVMAPPGAGEGHYIEAEVLTSGEQIRFAPVDRAIERLRPEDADHPERFETYERVLVELVEALPEQAGERSLARARTLLAASLPAPIATELSQMLSPFLVYHRAEHGFLGLTPGGPRSAEGAYVRLQFQDALRRAALGDELATRLYQTSHRMTEAHLKRQLLMEREDLDETEKQRLIRQQMEELAARQPGGGGE